MTRLHRLNPIAVGSRGLNLGITLPPVAPVPAETVCPPSTGGLTWVEAGDLLIVTASGTTSSGGSYAYPNFSAVASADRYQQWDLQNTSDSPVICRIVPVSGDLQNQLSGLIADGSAHLTPYPADGSLQPYFIVPPNSTIVLSAYSPNLPGNIVGTVIFRVEAASAT